jgi:hypothetical protein
MPCSRNINRPMWTINVPNIEKSNRALLSLQLVVQTARFGSTGCLNYYHKGIEALISVFCVFLTGTIRGFQYSTLVSISFFAIFSPLSQLELSKALQARDQ